MASRIIEVRFGGNMRDMMEGIAVPIYKHEPGVDMAAVRMFVHDFGPGKGMSIDLIIPAMYVPFVKAWNDGAPVMNQEVPNHFTLNLRCYEEVHPNG